MNDDIPETYAVESIEQMRAIADELRLRIVEALGRQAMTVTQLGALLGEAPAKIHYHVRELERVGLVKLVETREKGGILEKYYRSVARTINIEQTLIQSASPDAVTASASDFLRILSQGYLRAFAAALARGHLDDPDAIIPTISAGQVWMTPQELKRALEQVKELFQPYQAARGVPGEREITIANISYQAQSANPGVPHTSPISTDEGVPGGDKANL